MAIRYTITYTTYAAKHLASSAAVNKPGGCRFFHECAIQYQSLFSPDPNPAPDVGSPRTKRFSYSPYATAIAGEIFSKNAGSSPIAVGLATLLLKSTNGANGGGVAGALGVSPLKPGSILPFLQTSKWLPCNEMILGSRVDKSGAKTDDKKKIGIEGSGGSVKGAKRTVVSSEGGRDLVRGGVNRKEFERSSWLSKLLDRCCSEDTKAVFTALSVNILYKSSLAEARSIPSSSMAPTLDVGDRILAEKV